MTEETFIAPHPAPDSTRQTLYPRDFSCIHLCCAPTNLLSKPMVMLLVTDQIVLCSLTCCMICDLLLNELHFLLNQTKDL